MNLTLILSALGIRISPEQMAEIQKLITELPSLVDKAWTMLREMHARNAIMAQQISAIHKRLNGLGAVDDEWERQVQLAGGLPEQTDLEKMLAGLEAVENEQRATDRDRGDASTIDGQYVNGNAD